MSPRCAALDSKSAVSDSSNMGCCPAWATSSVSASRLSRALVTRPSLTLLISCTLSLFTEALQMPYFANTSALVRWSFPSQVNA